MAVSLHPTCSSSGFRSPCIVARSSRSLACAGSMIQSPSSFKIGKPSLNSELYIKAYKCIYRDGLDKPTRSTITMMPIGVPNVAYQNPINQSWQWIDLFNALYRERVIFIVNRIDQNYSNQLLSTMLYLDSIENSKKIMMYINGGGGEITPTMCVYDTMQTLRSPVSTLCIGYTYSLATFLLAAGEKGLRYSLPRSRIRLEPPAGTARGKADVIKTEASEVGRTRNYLFRELSNKTGRPLGKIYKDLLFGMALTADEAVEYGIIDSVLRPSKEMEEQLVTPPIETLPPA